MIGPLRNQTPARRDAAVRRLQTVNRSLIGLAVLSGAVLTDVAAHAFPGRTIKTVAGTSATVTGTPAGTVSASTTVHRRHRTHTSVAALRPPVSPPVSASPGDLAASSGGSSDSSGGSPDSSGGFTGSSGGSTGSSGGSSGSSGGSSGSSGGSSGSSASPAVYSAPAPVVVAPAAPAPVVSGGS